MRESYSFLGIIFQIEKSIFFHVFIGIKAMPKNTEPFDKAQKSNRIHLKSYYPRRQIYAVSFISSASLFHANFLKIKTQPNLFLFYFPGIW